MEKAAVAFRRLQVPSDVKGQVYLHSMPGRNENWPQFEAAMAASKIQAIVCLAPESEIARKSPAYATALRAELPYTVQCFPIPDYGLPADEKKFLAFIDSVASRVREGERVLVHCGAGVGRTGMFASCLLLTLGWNPSEARAAVQAAGSHPETNAQLVLIQRMATRRAGS